MMIVRIAAATLSMGLAGWAAYKALKPPPPRVCGSPGGPPITAPRVRLSDGRHLAYREFGVPKDEAKHKIVVAHGFRDSKDYYMPISPELIENLGIYFLFFDRAGYGESDPYPSRSVKSEAYDIQELADKLQIGSKFHVLGVSLGAYIVWSCLKYIPERLSGAALVVPFVNYWWPCLPPKLSSETFGNLHVAYRWTIRVAYYTPWLFYWWVTQKWFSSLNMLAAPLTAVFSEEELVTMNSIPTVHQAKSTQQGEYESMHRDILASYGKWEFDPAEIADPFPRCDGAVHIWQGYLDMMISFKINGYLKEKLPWIRYHEVPDGGHGCLSRSSVCEDVLKALLLG